MNLKFVLIGLVVATVLLFGATVVLMNAQPYAYHGSVIDKPARAPDFTLTAPTGKPFRLSEQTGKAVVLFFGYTSCPDVCPTTLYNFKKIRAQLTHQADQTLFVFITVDPERDTPERLGAYVTNFDPTFVGLTGTMPQLEAVWKSYGVYRQKQPGAIATGYTLDHSTRIYLIDAGGNLRVTYTDDTNADDLARDIHHLLDEKPAATGMSNEHSDAGDTPSNAVTVGDLKIEKAWARPALKNSTAGVFLMVSNSGTQADALIGAASTIAHAGEVHQTQMEGGMMKMQPIPRLSIPAGQTVELKPGGYHIMLVNLNNDVKAGEKVSVDLTFERAGKVTVTAEVIAQ